MNKTFSYPFSFTEILKEKKVILNKIKEIKEKKSEHEFRKLKIAILNGSSSEEISNFLQLFLFQHNIIVDIYNSNYNDFYEEAVFENKSLKEFKPDIIYLHTNFYNINMNSDINNNIHLFKRAWKSLSSNYNNIPIIQNNFELPNYRIYGNLDSSYPEAESFKVLELNRLFAVESQNISNLHINDINYLSSSIGLNNWFNDNIWNTGKYFLDFKYIPELCNSITSIILSILGKNKKGLILDLDNTLWGGVIGDDLIEGIKLGQGNAISESFSKFQLYLKKISNRGIIINIASKNDMENALLGLSHPESLLSKKDFNIIKANWLNKDINIHDIAKKTNIAENSLVFIDDNPVERENISSNTEVEVPDIGDNIVEYFKYIDRNMFFNTISVTKEDLIKKELYKIKNLAEEQEEQFEDYDTFLKSLNMKTNISFPNSNNIERIEQLINKTNQFNLTNKKFTQEELHNFLKSDEYIILNFGLSDKFGNHGLVSNIICKIENNQISIISWVMSCRVFKRTLENFILNTIADIAKDIQSTEIIGIYFNSGRNKYVSSLYTDLGFKEVSNKTNIPNIQHYILDVSSYKNGYDIIGKDIDE